MSLAEELLEQASQLASRDKPEPHQASLRRAVSTAYYALFHLLGGDAARISAPATPSNLRSQVQRASSHKDMKDTCKAVNSGKTKQIIVDLSGKPPSHDLEYIARVFVELQDARHKADYDVAVRLDRTDVKLLVQQCQSAFAAWAEVREKDEANVFLSALLLQARWKSPS